MNNGVIARNSPLSKGWAAIVALIAAERPRFPLFLPVWLASGIGLYFALPMEPSPVMLAGIACVLLILRRSFRHAASVRVGVAIVTWLTIGVLAASLRSHAVAAPSVYSPLFARMVEGHVVDIQPKQQGKKLVLEQVSIERISSDTTPRRISLTLRDTTTELHVGDYIRAKATLFPPPRPTMPGGFNLARNLFYERIGAVGYVIGAPEITQAAQIGSMEAWLNALRLRLNQDITKDMDEENGPVAAALMVGEMSAVSKEVGDAMRDAGLYHVLSISGLHMSLAVALLYVTLRFLLSLWPAFALRMPVKKIAATIGLLGAFGYLLIAGSPVPAIRSFIMVACVMVAILADRRGVSLYSLAWAAMLILLLQPESLLGASFQLSFAATFAILVFYERYSHLLFRPEDSLWRKIWLYFMGLMCTSLVASLATTPLVIYHFNRFSLWGIVANMLMIPLASFWIMPAAVLSFLLLPLGLAAWPLAWLDKGIGLMIAGSQWFSEMPFASIAVPSLTFAGLLLCIYGGLWLGIMQQRWRLLGMPLVVTGMMSVALHTPYDFLIGDGAQTVAQRLPGGEYLFLKGKPESYVGASWLRSDGRQSGLTLKDTPGAGWPECDKDYCLSMLHDKRILLARRKIDTPEKEAAFCAQEADMYITPDKLLTEACVERSLVFDRRALRRYGAIAIRVEQGDMRLYKANNDRGRLWNSRIKRGDADHEENTGLPAPGL